MRSIRMRMLGLGGIAAVVAAVGALALPASAQALRLPSGRSYGYPPPMSLAKPAMAPADPGSDPLTEQLGALEWVFPTIPQSPPLPNATFGSFPAACHYKDGTFIPDQNAKTCPKKASTGATFTFWHPDLVTMHVWIWYPNPAGLYSSTNPLVAPFNGG